MEKRYIIFGFLLICVIAGSYFIFNQNSTAVSDISTINDLYGNNTTFDDVNTLNSTDINKELSVNPISKIEYVLNRDIANNVTSNSNSDTPNSDGFNSGDANQNRTLTSLNGGYAVNLERENYLKNMNVYHDLTDRYVQCICGRFIPVGEMTKYLPQEAICNENSSYTGNDSYIYSGYIYTVSYEDAHDIWKRTGEDTLKSLEIDKENNFNVHADESISDTSENIPNSFSEYEEPMGNISLNPHSVF